MKSVLLIGMGKFGQTLGEKLVAMGDEVMIVDKNEDIVNRLAPKYAERAKEKDRKGGYTRVLKTSVRRGDNAQMALVELI